jgi:selenide,water dikinase
VKRGIASSETIEAAIAAMTSSAAHASKVMQDLGANACTDVTGFGLLGHTFEMARASRMTVEIDAGTVPLLPDVLELIRQGMLTRGDRNNRVYVGEAVEISDRVSDEMQSALFDPQTAGGLLVSLVAGKASEFLARVPQAVVIGRITEASGGRILVG